MNVDKIFSLFKKHGNSDYIGENVTQLSHAIQAAMLAEERKFGNDMIVACLLHDIGHLVGIENKEEEMKDDTPLWGGERSLIKSLGIKNHEVVGANFLKECGFNDVVCNLVKNHVDAKRFLVTVSKNYRDNLSEASKKTLQYQKLMSDEEVDKFVNNKLFTLSISLRKIDDQAKKQDIKLNDLEYYRLFLFKSIR